MVSRLNDKSIFQINDMNIPKLEAIKPLKNISKLSIIESKNDLSIFKGSKKNALKQKNINDMIEITGENQVNKIKSDIITKRSQSDDKNSAAKMKALLTPTIFMNQHIKKSLTENVNATRKQSINESSFDYTSSHNQTNGHTTNNNIDQNTSILIQNCCDQSFSLINQGIYHKALNILTEAENFMEKIYTNDLKLNYEVIHMLFNNLAVSYYRLNLLDSALMYADSILINLALAKKQRKSQIQQNSSGRIIHEAIQYYSTMSQRLRSKTYKCKTNMQKCIILSEFARHKEALKHARSAARYACELMINTLLVLYHLIQKGKDNSSANMKLTSKHMKKNSATDNINIGDSHSKLLASFTNDQNNPNNNDMNGMNERTFLKDFKFSNNHTFDSDTNDINKEYKDKSPNIDCEYYMKIARILEDIIKRIQDLIKISPINENKADRLMVLMKKLCPNLSTEELNLFDLYSHVIDGHWLLNTNLLAILQLKAIKTEHLKLKTDLNEEVKPDILIERITMLIASIYSISTEMRFINQAEGLNFQGKEPSEAEIWMSKSMELAYLFLPHEAPIAGQILSVYTKFHSLSKQVIPEDEEINDNVMLLKPFKGGSTTDFFIPLIRSGKIANVLEKSHNEEEELQEAFKSLNERAEKLYNLLQKNFIKNDTNTKIRNEDLAINLKKISNTCNANSLIENSIRIRNHSLRINNEPDINGQSNDSYHRLKQKKSSRLTIKSNPLMKNFFSNDNTKANSEETKRNDNNIGVDSEDNLDKTYTKIYNNNNNASRIREFNENSLDNRMENSKSKPINQEVQPNENSTAPSTASTAHSANYLIRKVHPRGFLSELNLKKKSIYQAQPSILLFNSTDDQANNKLKKIEIKLINNLNNNGILFGNNINDHAVSENTERLPSKESRKEKSDDENLSIQKVNFKINKNSQHSYEKQLKYTDRNIISKANLRSLINNRERNFHRKSHLIRGNEFPDLSIEKIYASNIQHDASNNNNSKHILNASDINMTCASKRENFLDEISGVLDSNIKEELNQELQEVSGSIRQKNRSSKDYKRKKYNGEITEHNKAGSGFFNKVDDESQSLQSNEEKLNQSTKGYIRKRTPRKSKMFNQ